MTPIATLIMSKRLEHSQATNKAKAKKIGRIARWLEAVAAIVGDEMMVNETAVIAAADWVSAKNYARYLLKKQ